MIFLTEVYREIETNQAQIQDFEKEAYLLMSMVKSRDETKPLVVVCD